LWDKHLIPSATLGKSNVFYRKRVITTATWPSLPRLDVEHNLSASAYPLTSLYSITVWDFEQSSPDCTCHKCHLAKRWCCQCWPGLGPLGLSWRRLHATLMLKPILPESLYTSPLTLYTFYHSLTSMTRVVSGAAPA
jgi:hypothetical protein